jgi:hypothetical protein
MRQGARALALVAVLAGCSGIPVHVSTPKPIEVNVNMKVEIFQRKVETPEDVQPATPTEETGTSDEETRRRERMGQIQSFKNSRIVGENRNGLLTIMRLPQGEYGKQVEQAVAAENADRTALMKVEATERRVPLATVEAEQAAEWRQRAFDGEWIEEQQADGTWRWVQKRPGGESPALVVPPPPGSR